MAASSQNSPTSKSGFWPLWLALGVTALFLLGGVFLGLDAKGFLTEGGPVENATVAALCIAALGFVVMAPDRALGPRWHVTAVLLLMAARELDFDKRFLAKGILQARLYTGDTPVLHKLIGLAVLALIFLAVGRLIWLHWRSFLQGLRNGEGWTWSLAVALVLVVVAKAFDGAGRKLEPFGITLDPDVDRLLSGSEEVMELGCALLIVLSVCLWNRARGKASPGSS